MHLINKIYEKAKSLAAIFYRKLVQVAPVSPNTQVLPLNAMSFDAPYEELGRELDLLLGSINSGRTSEQGWSRIVAILEHLPAKAVYDSPISLLVNKHFIALHHHYSGDKMISASLYELLRQHPKLALLFTFHHDGFVREEALSHLEDPPTCQFMLAAILVRLNDWVPEVRNAADAYLSRTIVHTSADAIFAARA